CQKCGKYFPTKAFMKKHAKVMHSNRKESGVQGIQKDSQSAILEKGHDIAEELTYNADQSKNDGTAIVKNSRQINRKQSGNNGHVNGDVKNLRPWKLRSSNVSD
ncbi:6494_t:CDS:1, partial [Rhizophagus irregularis]